MYKNSFPSYLKNPSRNKSNLPPLAACEEPFGSEPIGRELRAELLSRVEGIDAGG